MFFAKHFESSDNYKLDKGVEGEVAKSLLKFLYTGALEYSNASSLVSFMIFANQYKFKGISEFKVPAKIYLTGIIEYVEKDLNNRVNEFDRFCETVDFKKWKRRI